MPADRTGDHGRAAPGFAATGPPVPLRKHQREALDALDPLVGGARRRAWVVLPPGAGKTLVGLEFARRVGRPTVVLGPNTAIQSQWVAEWGRFQPPVVPVGVDRELSEPVTALTYQALATFSPDEEVDEEGQASAGEADVSGSTTALIERLHPNGRALIDAMRAEPELTVVLDECHHLLDVWGRLVAELLGEIPRARVLGLTATPPATLSDAQRELVGELFGTPVYAASIPAAVREGTLVPFGELVWLTTPTPAETQWLSAEAERFSELVTALTDPSFGSTPFLRWLDERFVRRERDGAQVVPWYRLEKEMPDAARAALRFHYGGLLALPTGARLREEHRSRPTADDWVRLVDDWVRNCLGRSESAADEEACERIRAALPSIGYRMTRGGIRVGRSPVDRLLARSEAKTVAAAEIVRADSANLGDRLRMLVLCDHERATATVPASLSGVLAEDAGSARLVLDTLVDSPDTRAHGPVLVTGRCVAAEAATAKALVDYVGRHAPHVRLDPIDDQASGVVDVTGRWSSRQWVRLVTDFFEAGGCQVLVGTRALLGEGWDARGVTGVVDLTTATTPTAVVQTRGRALRTDPGWAEKVALTWTVVCVTEQHPKGAADWGRFVRKHDGYYALDDHGDVVAGVAHVDAGLSPYGPPPVTEFDAVNAAMLTRAGRRRSLAELWQVGAGYADRFVHTLRLRPVAAPAATGRADTLVSSSGAVAPVAVPAENGLSVARGSVPGGGGRTLVAAGLSLLLAFGVVRFRLLIVAAVLVLVMLGALVTSGVRAWRAGRLVAEAAEPVDTLRVAYAVADGLHGAGLAPVGAEAVRWVVEPDGSYQFALGDVTPDVSARFAAALDDAVSPIGTPRYVLPRYLLDAPSGDGGRLLAGARVLFGRLRPSAVVWHAVPEELGVNGERARAFAAAWRRWVSDGEPLYTGSPEGAGVLRAQSGADPFAVTTAMRTSWE